MTRNPKPHTTGETKGPLPGAQDDHDADMEDVPGDEADGFGEDASAFVDQILTGEDAIAMADPKAKRRKGEFAAGIPVPGEELDG